MIVTVYRSECSLWSRGDLVLSFLDYRFYDRPLCCKEAATGFTRLRSSAVPIRIKVPVGSRLSNDRLLTYFSERGLDATSVHFMATHHIREFQLEESAHAGSHHGSNVS